MVHLCIWMSEAEPLAPVEPCFNLMSPHGSRNMANASVHVGCAGNPSVHVGSAGNPSVHVGSAGNPSVHVGNAGNPSAVSYTHLTLPTMAVV